LGSIPDPYFSRDVPSIDDDTEDADEHLDEITYDDVDIEQDDETETSLDDLDEGLEGVDDEEDVDLDALSGPFVEEEEEEEEEFTYDEEDYD
jgi:hypothetical protein